MNAMPCYRYFPAITRIYVSRLKMVGYNVGYNCTQYSAWMVAPLGACSGALAGLQEWPAGGLQPPVHLLLGFLPQYLLHLSLRGAPSRDQPSRRRVPGISPHACLGTTPLEQGRENALDNLDSSLLSERGILK